MSFLSLLEGWRGRALRAAAVAAPDAGTPPAAAATRPPSSLPPGGLDTRGLLGEATGERPLLEAWERVRDNGGAPGAHGQDIASFGTNVLRRLQQLRSEVPQGALPAATAAAAGHSHGRGRRAPPGHPLRARPGAADCSTGVIDEWVAAAAQARQASRPW